MRLPSLRLLASTGAAAGLVVALVGLNPDDASASRTHGSSTGRSHQDSLHARTLFSGSALGISNPDDITALGQRIFVAFQNGVGPQGQPSSKGATDSTIVELTKQGKLLRSWNIAGKCDGLTADPATGVLIATVNEDLNSSLYTIDPSQLTAQHYSYSPSPLPHHGGTDAVSVVDGSIYISASAPGTTGDSAPQASYPALYSVSLDPSDLVATATPVFFDESNATVANGGPAEGSTLQLALTDPDSNEVVPGDARRFAGQFLLTSQGDQQQIFVQDIGGAAQQLSVLNLSQSVDDSAWPTAGGTLVATDSTHDTVDAVRGHFDPGAQVVAVTPCGANSAPSTCPGPGYPANYLGTVNLWTGEVSAITVRGADLVPQGGLLFLQSGRRDAR